MPDSIIDRLRVSALRFRNELIALALLFGATLFFRPTVPLGIHALGIVGASSLLLHAIGIVLVFRVNGFINFAQLQLGVAAATLTVYLANGQALIRLVRSMCGGCIAQNPGPTAVNINFTAAVVIGLAFGIGTSWVMYRLLVRRFEKSSRLVVTILSIFVAQALSASVPRLQPYLVDPVAVEAGLNVNAPPVTPFTFTLGIDPIPLQWYDIATFIAAFAALAGVILWMRRSSTGTTIRAASENPDRAASLGVDVGAVTAQIWLIVGAVASVAGILNAMGSGLGEQAPDQFVLPVGQLVVILAVAVVARFTSLPMVAAGAVTLGILRQGMLWSFGSVAPLDAMIVAIIGGLLVIQRAGGGSRADRESGQTFAGSTELRPIPAELAGVGVVRRWVRNLRTVGVVLLLGIPWLLSPAQANLAGAFVIFYMVGLSLLVLSGWAGQVSLGQFAFGVLGAWVTASMGIPTLLALPIAGVAGAIMAVIVGVPALRLRGLQLAVSTLAFAVSATVLLTGDRYLGRLLPDSIDRPTIVGINLDDQRAFWYFAVAVAVLITVAVAGLRNSRTGRVLIAARDNEAAVQSFGVSLLRARLTGFAVSGFIAALAGGMYAIHQNGVNAESFAAERSVEFFTFAVIGGLGGIAGQVLGFGFYGLLNLLSGAEILRFLAAGVGGLILLGAAPGGLAQLVFDGRDSLLRRVAYRYRIVVPSLVEDSRTSTRRAPIMERPKSSAGTSFVPQRYEPEGQWALEAMGRATETDDDRDLVVRSSDG